MSEQDEGGVSFNFNVSGSDNKFDNKISDVTGRDKIEQVEGDKISLSNVSGTVAVGRGATATSTVINSGLQADLQAWKAEIEARLAALSGYDEADKADVRDQLDKIEQEAHKQAAQVEQGEAADPRRLERSLNALGAVAPEIFDVAVASIANPLANLGLSAVNAGGRVQLNQQT